jgi:hypothetical protein
VVPARPGEVWWHEVDLGRVSAFVEVARDRDGAYVCQRISIDGRGKPLRARDMTVPLVELVNFVVDEMQGQAEFRVKRSRLDVVRVRPGRPSKSDDFYRLVHELARQAAAEAPAARTQRLRELLADRGFTAKSDTTVRYWRRRAREKFGDD